MTCVHPLTEGSSLNSLLYVNEFKRFMTPPFKYKQTTAAEKKNQNYHHKKKAKEYQRMFSAITKCHIKCTSLVPTSK